MNKKSLLIVIVTLSLVLGANSFFVYSNGLIAEASSSLKIPAKVTATKLNVRKTASIKGKQLTVDGTKVAIKKGTKVTIIKQKVVDGLKWYYVSFSYNNKTKKGYVSSDFVCITFKYNVSATIKASSSIKIRKGAGSDKSYLKIDGKTISLKNKEIVVVTRETKDKKGGKWFKISFEYKGKIKAGYVPSNNTTLTGISYKVGQVKATSLNVRKSAGLSGKKLTYNNMAVALKDKTLVEIKKSKTVDDVTWYQVSFEYDDTLLSGYVSGQYIVITNKMSITSTKVPSQTETPSPSTEPSEEPKSSEEPKPSEKPESTEKPEASEIPENTPIPDSEFQSYLSSQGFPDSYKEALTKLHTEHPNWIFKAYQTGLDWDTVIANETKIGLNLISNKKTSGWLSFEEGAYNWSTDAFIPYDGSTWVTASKEAVEFYMDPRNFLFQNSIFQFEALEYQPEYQIKSGVETILKNTPMGGNTFTYFDEETLEEKTIEYSQAFMDAANFSSVSPYHLASRVKQEVIRSATTFSNSVTGTVPGYEGYYNFYNIGATHSTTVAGAIANGLNFAMGNTISSETTKLKYNLPWDNQYKAIIGGAKFIGTNYINRGQNTIHTQKFNSTPHSTYTHQYMANVEAANSEAAKTYTAYNEMGLLDTVLVFNIPVYENMPKNKCSVPAVVKNPNNWLKTLKLGNYTLQPSFKASYGGYKDYTLLIDDSSVSSLTLSAVTASSKASFDVSLTQDTKVRTLESNGIITIPLVEGENKVSIVVTAENGDENTYIVTITKVK